MSKMKHYTNVFIVLIIYIYVYLYYRAGSSMFRTSVDRRCDELAKTCFRGAEQQRRLI